jgi:hypothetical protein
MIKISVLVLSCSHADYSAFKAAQVKSWVNDFSTAGISVYFVEGLLKGSSKPQFTHIPPYSIDGNLISVECDDTLNDSFRKTLAGMDFLFNSNKCDVVLRTNLSSFLDISKFLQYIKVHNVNSTTYTGVIGKTTISREIAYNNKQRFLTKLLTHLPLPFLARTEFASGACYFIGSEVFDDICRSTTFLNLVDDVAISYAGASKFLIKTDFPRLWVNSLSKGVDRLALCTFKKNLGFHYRFKSPYRDVDALLLSSFGDPEFRDCWIEEQDSYDA